jgi:hypothetical protein
MNMSRREGKKGVASVASVIVGLSIAGALSGCALIDGGGNASPGATAMSTSAAESSQSATPKAATATPTTAPAAFMPVGLSCSVLLPDSFIFEVGPNFARSDDYVPSGESTDGYIAANSGLACRILNLSGGDHIDVAVAKLNAAGIADLTNDFSSTQAEVSDFGSNVRGFFTDAGGVGQANVITDSYWVVVSSPLFSQARDSAPIIAEVLSKLT